MKTDIRSRKDPIPNLGISKNTIRIQHNHTPCETENPKLRKSCNITSLFPDPEYTISRLGILKITFRICLHHKLRKGCNITSLFYNPEYTISRLGIIKITFRICLNPKLRKGCSITSLFYNPEYTISRLSI